MLVDRTKTPRPQVSQGLWAKSNRDQSHTYVKKSTSECQAWVNELFPPEVWVYVAVGSAQIGHCKQKTLSNPTERCSYSLQRNECGRVFTCLQCVIMCLNVRSHLISVSSLWCSLSFDHVWTTLNFSQRSSNNICSIWHHFTVWAPSNSSAYWNSSFCFHKTGPVWSSQAVMWGRKRNISTVQLLYLVYIESCSPSYGSSRISHLLISLDYICSPQHYRVTRRWVRSIVVDASRFFWKGFCFCAWNKSKVRKSYLFFAFCLMTLNVSKMSKNCFDFFQNRWLLSC